MIGNRTATGLRSIRLEKFVDSPSAGQHRPIHTQHAAFVFAGPADADPAAHVGFPTELAGHIIGAGQLAQRRQHAVRPAGKDAVHLAAAQQWGQRIGDASRLTGAAVLGCGVERQRRRGAGFSSWS